MLEELRIFLIDNATPEENDLFNQAYEIIDELYSVEVQNYYQDILFTQDESIRDTGETLNKFYQLFKNLLFRILTEHQITVNEDIDFARLIKIVQALLDIQGYDNLDDIVYILETEDDNEQKLAEALALVCDMQAEELLLEIENVSDGFITNLQEFTKVTPISNIIEDAVDTSVYLNRIKQFNKFIKIETRIFKLMKEGLKAGYTFEVYSNIFGRELETLSVDEIVLELLSMCYMSVDGYNNPKATIKAHIDKMISDFRKITQVDIKITDMLLKYQTWLDQTGNKPQEYLEN